MLVAVHTVASSRRLEDIVGLLEADARIGLLYGESSLILDNRAAKPHFLHRLARELPNPWLDDLTADAGRAQVLRVVDAVSSDLHETNVSGHSNLWLLPESASQRRSSQQAPSLVLSGLDELLAEAKILAGRATLLVSLYEARILHAWQWTKLLRKVDAVLRPQSQRVFLVPRWLPMHGERPPGEQVASSPRIPRGPTCPRATSPRSLAGYATP